MTRRPTVPVIALIVLLTAACSNDSSATATQVMAVISAEPTVSDMTADVRVVVRSGQGDQSSWEERLDRKVPTDREAAWPVEVSITPKSDDATRVYEVTATALDDAGAEIARVRAISGFVEGKALQLALVFEGACLGKVAECDETETCRAGSCEDAHVDVLLLPPYSGDPQIVAPGVDGGGGAGGDGGQSGASGSAGGGAGGTSGTTGRDAAVELNCPPDEMDCDGTCANLMTDPVNCGDCGVACRAMPGDEPGCDAGECPVVIAQLATVGNNPPTAIAANGINVYWSTAYDVNVGLPFPMQTNVGEVSKVPVVGGLPTTLSTMTPTTGLVVDDVLYLSMKESDASLSNGNIIATLALSGGTPTSLNASGPKATASAGLAASAGSVYWMAGGSAYKRGPSDAGPVVLNENSIPGYATGIAVQAGSVYWPMNSNGACSIWQVSAAGGTAVKVADVSTSNGAVRGFAVDGSNVYWVTAGTAAATGTVMMVPTSGGTPSTLASGQPYPYAVVTDGTSVFWVNAGPPAGVMKVPVAGGTPVELATEQGVPRLIAIDESSVFWATDSAIMMRSPR